MHLRARQTGDSATARRLIGVCFIIRMVQSEARKTAAVCGAAPWMPAYVKLLEAGERHDHARRAEQAAGDGVLCARACHVDRHATIRGAACRTGAHAVVYTFGPHHGEEDCLSGRKGSGTIFFSGCNLRCVFCQNFDVSQDGVGLEARPERLAQMMLELQETGCHNVNFVTPEHVVPQLLEALPLAVARGLAAAEVHRRGARQQAVGADHADADEEDQRREPVEVRAAGCEEIFEDHASGACPGGTRSVKADRPGLAKALGHIRSGETLVAWNRRYGDVFTVRSVFVIGPDKKIKLMITYPASTGRNFDEIMRVIDSLQLTSKYSVATPVNWKDGDDVIIVPSLSDEDAKEKFPGGWRAPKPYLRITPQPNKTGAPSDTAAKTAS